MRRRGFALVLVALMVLVVAGTASAKPKHDGCGKFDSDVIGVEGVSLSVD
ncbi:MAG: hypothetical protein HKO87_01570, partial [Acidimicrobiia bacterium]|nr:hypothetical protein [Acidimicrobiia bacterium]